MLQPPPYLSHSTVILDPHFVGFRGERYDFMGAPDRWFAILSDPEVQINAEFSAVPGNDWGTYINRIAVSHPGGRLLVTSGRDELGPVALDVRYYLLRIIRNYYEHGYEDALNGVPHLNLEVDLGPGWTRRRGTHGVLGQTASAAWPGVPTGGDQGEGVVEGAWTDYEVSGPWSAEFAYGRSRVPMMV